MKSFRLVRRLGYFVLFTLLLLETGFLAYDNLQSQRAIVGLRLNHVWLTGLNQRQIDELIQQQQDGWPALRLRHGEQLFLIQPRELGMDFHSQGLRDQLLAYGHRGDLWQRLREQHQALYRLPDDVFQISLSQTFLTVKLLELQDHINKLPLPARPDFSHDPTRILPSEAGEAVQVDQLGALIQQQAVRQTQTAFDIPTATLAPGVHASDEIDAIRKQAIELTQEPLAIRYAGQTLSFSPDALRNLLTVVERPDGQDPHKTQLQLRIDSKPLNIALGTFGAKIEAITHAEFNDHDARTALFAAFYQPQRHTIEVPAMDQPIEETLALKTSQAGDDNVSHLDDQLAHQGRPDKQTTTNVSLFHWVMPAEAATAEAVALAATGTADTAAKTNKIAYLTFDDGPNNLYHPLILDILNNYQVSSTFFLVGKNADKYPDVSLRTHQAGHEIGDHSLTHAFLPKLGAKGIRDEVEKTKTILKKFNGNKDIVLFRPPYGGVSAAVRKDAKDLKLKLVLWSVDPRDWSEPSTAELVRRVIANTRNGSDILLHSNHAATVIALPKIIEQLQKKGYTFKVL